MKNIDKACIKETSESNIKFEEKRSKIIFQNRQKKSYFRVQVDGCAIKEGVKCDNMLIGKENGDEYYIELKGCNVKHAVEQLEVTICKLSVDAQNMEKKAFVVCTKNNYPSSTIQLDVKKFKKKHHTELIIKETPCNYSLDVQLCKGVEVQAFAFSEYRTEVRSARGRADAVVKTKDAIFVFEFKQNSNAEEALKQIDEKEYLIPYTLDGKRLVKIGVNFSKEMRNVERYLVEEEP